MLDRVTAAIFDVDGTLAETEEVHRRAFNRAFADFGLEWRWDERLYRQLLLVTGGKERLAHFLDRNGLTTSVAIAELHRVKTHYYGEMIADGAAPLRPGVAETLEAARAAGVELAIATTTSAQNVEALLKPALGADWRHIFPKILAGDMVERKKPAPDIYQLALAELKAPPADCVAIEDSRNGVLAARGAGLTVLAVRSTYCRDDDLSDADLVLPDCVRLKSALFALLAA